MDAKAETSSKGNNDYKKGLVEKWLVNISAEYDAENAKHCQDLNSSLATLQTESPSTSQLDFWDVGDTEYKSKKKNSKLQFLRALKKIFKRKRGEYGSDDIIGEMSTDTTLNILGMDSVNENIVVEVEEKKTTEQQINTDSAVNYNSGFVEENKTDRVTKTRLEEHFVRIGGAGASFKNLNGSDHFNRGYSEIIRTKPLYPSGRIEEVTESKFATSNSETKCTYCDLPGNEVLPEPNTIGDNWDIRPTRDSYNGVVEIDDNYIEQQSSCTTREDSSFKEPIYGLPKKSVVNQVDSYIRKLNLIKTFFATKSTKTELRAKPSIPTIALPLTSCVTSRSMSHTDSCALTKDLTEAPYLREHERLQWQGKNRELWFRISALYHKYNHQHSDNDRKDPYIARNYQKLQRYQDSVPKVGKRNSRIAVTEYRSYLERNRPTYLEARKSKLNKVGCGQDFKRHVKLEQIFVTEHIKNRPDTQFLHSTRSGQIKQTYSNNGQPKTHGWHLTLEQVRASMQRMSEEEFHKIIPIVTVRGSRCQSKISVAISASDEWEDVSNSVESCSSQQSAMRLKPLPNIPYTPSFRHYFRTKL